MIPTLKQIGKSKIRKGIISERHENDNEEIDKERGFSKYPHLLALSSTQSHLPSFNSGFLSSSVRLPPAVSNPSFPVLEYSGTCRKSDSLGRSLTPIRSSRNSESSDTALAFCVFVTNCQKYRSNGSDRHLSPVPKARLSAPS